MAAIAPKGNATTVIRARRLRLRPVPMIGWVMTSRSELAQAQRLLLDEQEGVVDELGLLTIHQAVSDRLFPGTSVLHTRLRYVLFVPWLMRLAASERDPSGRLRELEFALTGKLRKGTEGDKNARRGIIGGRIYPDKAAAQPASYSYWTALSTWGLLGPQWIEGVPSRDVILGELSELAAGKIALDGDGQPLIERTEPFAVVPAMPALLLTSEAGVDFRLEPEEQVFIRRRLSTVRAPLQALGESPRMSLLANLASRKAKLNDRVLPWLQDRVLAAAGHNDREVLALAAGLSAISGVARAAYLTMVEMACSAKFNAPGRRHEAHFHRMRGELGRAALNLDMPRVLELGLVRASDPIVPLLQETQRCIAGSTSMSSLQGIYVEVEKARKGSRARLSGKRGATVLLRDWARSAEKIRLAEPLHFRWSNVVMLLNDLNGH